MSQKYLFSESELQTPREIIFAASPLGKLRSVLPLEELSKQLPQKKFPQGAKGWLDRSGMLALLFLKAYTGLSDASLIEHLNGNWQMQLFCGIRLAEHEQIGDETLVSRIRTKVAKHLNLEQFQQKLLNTWKPYLKNTHVNMQDATVYESYIKYPTDAKLLWDCCCFCADLYRRLCKDNGIKQEKHSFEAQKLKQRVFDLRKKKTHKLRQRRRGQLLRLLRRLLGLIRPIMDTYKMNLSLQLSPFIVSRLQTVIKIEQQQVFLHNNPGKKLSGRIVSLYKPYIRPIVRGKENKAVEFGVKVHMMQVDSINIVEHYSYDAFNECTRLEPAVKLHQSLLGDCHQLAGDRIYGTNSNRKFLNNEKIAHNFIPKGKGDTAQKKQLRGELNKARSTVLEGSFGNEKNHYGLRKVAARNQPNETLWVFFGIMTANAMKIIQKKKENIPPRQAA